MQTARGPLLHCPNRVILSLTGQDKHALLRYVNTWLPLATDLMGS